MKGWHINTAVLPNTPSDNEKNEIIYPQTGGYDFTDISPDDPNTLDPFRHFRFWFILDFFRTNFLTR